MKKTRLKKLMIFAVTFGLIFIFYSALAIAQGSNDTGEKQTSPEKTAMEQIKESVLDARTEAEVAGKEVEVRKKAIELEKKKADVERRESDLAKKEAEVIKETAESRVQVKKAVERVEQEEKEAVAAVEMVAISEEKMLIAQEKARIALEQLEIEKEKADVAEAKARARRNIVFVKIFQTILVLGFGYLLIFLLVGAVNRGVKDLKAKHLIRKDIIYILNFIIIVAVILVWGHNVESITIFISAVGAGVAVALHEAILCIAGWLLILLRRPFEVGDRVELGGVKGDVIDIQLFHTALLEIGNWVEDDQSTGRLVSVPNSAVFKQENFNYDRGFEYIWNEIRVLVTFESDWKRAKEIMLVHAHKVVEGKEEIVKKKIKAMSSRYMIHYGKLTPIVYSKIKDSGVELTLRYLTEAKKRRATQDALCQAILDDFEKEEKVNFAYTTYRIVK